MKPAIRVGLVCDLREEGWHSMDLIADMLMEMLPRVPGPSISVTQLCPPMTQRWTRLPLVGGAARARLGDRLTGRFWDYPRWLAPRIDEFDVFHIVDHSYAHLTTVLPPGNVIVTCNDVDAIQAALPGRAGVLDPSRVLASRVLDGLTRAAHVTCISRATRADLLATGRISPDRVSVAHLGVHPACSPDPDPASDREVESYLGAQTLELLHVGSTIARKRIDVLLRMLSGVRREMPEIRLVRVGGPLTSAQRALAAELGVSDAVSELPFLNRRLLAAVYRRAALVVLPSDREGFGLPLVEAMACGAPVVASAIPALLEIGGGAATYCQPGDVDLWVTQILDLLRTRARDRAGWEMRRRACLAAAAPYDWRAYASAMARLYGELATVRMRAS